MRVWITRDSARRWGYRLHATKPVWSKDWGEWEGGEWISDYQARRLLGHTLKFGESESITIRR